MIKLIVNYSYSDWNGNGYSDHKRSKIFKFSNLSQISNKRIEDELQKIHSKPITVIEMQKL